MRRRARSSSEALPANLRKFVSTDWPGRDEAERYGRWMRARDAWKDDRGIIQTADDEAAMMAFPDGEFRYEDV